MRLRELKSFLKLCFIDFYLKVNRKERKRFDNVAVVSLTSYPARIGILERCLRSILNQNCKPKKIIITLSLSQFRNKYLDLPNSLVDFISNNESEIQVLWVNEDIKPHKKWFYAFQLFSQFPIITLDDDVIYHPSTIRFLIESYVKFPHCVSCHRGNLMMFGDDGDLLPYKAWQINFQKIKGEPTYQILPTGVGGILYPPPIKSIPKIAYNKDDFEEICPIGDDLWLKVMTAINSYPSVIVKNSINPKIIEGSQSSALWVNNITSGNDLALNKIFYFLEKNKIIPDKKWLLKKLNDHKY